MARRKKSPDPANHDRWLISYADFITLLFAFFVVMFASSQVDKGRAEQVSESVKKALEGKSAAAIIAAVLGGTVDNSGQGNAMMKGPGGKVAKDQAPQPQSVELTPSFKMLSEEMKEEIAAGRITISMQPRGLVVSFTQAALFPSGEDEISMAAYAGLEKVAGAIARIPNPVRLEGHTDSIPIKTARFRGNWELSAARSIAVLDLLSKRFGLPPSRMSVAGYAETAPVDSNDKEAGRARNRRVDIVLLNQLAGIAEPPKALAKGHE